MDNIKQNKPRRWLKIASYIGLGLFALETALLIGSCVVSCSGQDQETQAADYVRTTAPVAKPLAATPRPEGYSNLLDDAEHFDRTIIQDFPWPQLNIKPYGDHMVSMLTLEAGRYYIGCDSDDANYCVYGQCSPQQAEDMDLAEELRRVSDSAIGGGTYNVSIADAAIPLTALVDGGGNVTNAYLSLTQTRVFLVTYRRVDRPYIYLIDESTDVSDVAYNLPSTYDFRRWVANVDPATGCLSLETRWDNGVGFRNFVFPFVWQAGDGKVYNYIYMNVIGLDSANALIVNGNGDAKVASNIFGENWSKFSMLMNIRFGFSPSYDGTFMDVANGSVNLNPLYEAKVYTNTLVSGSLDGQGLAGYDCRYLGIPAMYRYFDVYQDRGLLFSTPSYSNVTTGELLNMDLNAVVILGDVSTSPMSMLTQGFNAIASILAIQVLPNVTLGLLMFIPLVVTIILVIVRLLQK